MPFKLRYQDMVAIKKHLVAVGKSIDRTGINTKVPSSIKKKKLLDNNTKLINFIQDNYFV